MDRGIRLGYRVECQLERGEKPPTPGPSTGYWAGMDGGVEDAAERMGCFLVSDPLLLLGEGWESGNLTRNHPQQCVNAGETSGPFFVLAAVWMTIHDMQQWLNPWSL